MRGHAADAQLHRRRLDADHAACLTRPRLFNQALLQACWSVEAARSGQVQPDVMGTAL